MPRGGLEPILARGTCRGRIATRPGGDWMFEMYQLQLRYVSSTRLPFRVDAGIDNVFDKSYFRYLSEDEDPGRDYRVAVSYGMSF